MDEEEDAEEAEAGVLEEAFELVMSTSWRRYSVLLPILVQIRLKIKHDMLNMKERVGFLGPREERFGF